MVCSGAFPLKDAQQAIVTDWVVRHRPTSSGHRGIRGKIPVTTMQHARPGQG
jgi:hypothetical protein